LSAPARPVKALALPELTTSTRPVPPGRCLRHQSTGADAVLDWVKTPATWLPGAMTTIRRSLWSRYLMPAGPVASRTPASGGRLAKIRGASGDFGWAWLALAGAAAALAAGDELSLPPPLEGALPRALVPPCIAMAPLPSSHRTSRFGKESMAARIRPYPR